MRFIVTQDAPGVFAVHDTHHKPAPAVVARVQEDIGSLFDAGEARTFAGAIARFLNEAWERAGEMPNSVTINAAASVQRSLQREAGQPF